MEVSRQNHSLTALTKKKKPGAHPPNRSLAGLQRQSIHFGEEKWKISTVPTRIRNPNRLTRSLLTIQTTKSSLLMLRLNGATSVLLYTPSRYGLRQHYRLISCKTISSPNSTAFASPIEDVGIILQWLSRLLGTVCNVEE